MAKVSAAELGELKGNIYFNNLEELSKIYKSAARTFDNFATYSSRRLKGEGYDAIRSVVSALGTSFSKLSPLDLNAHDNVERSLSQFISFMDDYATLDDSRLTMLSSRLTYLSDQIGMSKALLDKGELKGDALKSTKAWYSESCQSYATFKKEHDKLEKLAAKDKATGACIDSIVSDTGNLSRLIRDMIIEQ